MSEELKACPFCGDGEPLMRGDDWVYVGCYECDASGPALPTEAEAITAWNTRAGKILTPTQIREMLAGERERAAKAATEVSDTYYDQREEAESDKERVYADERMCAAQECAEAIRNLGAAS